MYGKDLDRTETFGPTLTMPQPEEWVAPNGSKHLACFLQLKEKYTDTPQTLALVPPVQGKEVTNTCCDRTFWHQAQHDRHSRWIHFGRRHGAKRKRAGTSTRAPKRRKSHNSDVDKHPHEQDEQLEQVEQDEREEREVNGTDTESGEDSEDEQYEAGSIVGKMTLRGVVHYIVCWKGFSPQDDSPKPIENLKHCAALGQEFDWIEADAATARAATLGLRNPCNS